MHKVYRKHTYFAKKVLYTLGTGSVFLVIVITAYSNFFATKVKIEEI